ncbi:MAG: formamidopyrimidine-DNA glycosylase [Eubacteriales bacterium]|nr:formamidopyrimidine-DNA glycosylase [Eubacteriales bacterium]MDN5363140.1 formamidopyrimidine-DNA glycosylase [Eubacteriales bacterium]
MVLPELPEVETVVRTLRNILLGQKIAGVNIFRPEVVKEPEAKSFSSLLAGREITALRRRGKFILLSLSGDQVLVIHLRMTGRLVISKKEEKHPPHTHVIINLDDGRELRFIDPRRFGRMWLLPAAELPVFPPLAGLGMEPLTEEFTVTRLQEMLQPRRAPVKAVLLNQSLLAGLGNIYADEALHRAGIHPARPACSLTAGEVESLHRAIGDVLKEGIAHRGTTFRDYVDGEGKKGGFQNFLRVYGRAGEPCLTCGTPVAKMKICGRTTSYCPACQPYPAN